MIKEKLFPYLLVSLQFGSLLYLFATGPWIAKTWDGILLESAGIILGLTAIYVAGIHNVNITPLPKIGGVLVIGGPYSLVRHPMYLAQILAVIPLIIDQPDNSRIAVFVLLVVTLIYKIFYEEKKLVEQFGNDYVEYQRKTFRILPWVF